MKTLSASLLSSGISSASRFEAARQLAYSMAESDQESIEPELIARVDRSGSIFSSEAVAVSVRTAGTITACPTAAVATRPLSSSPNPDEWTSKLT